MNSLFYLSTLVWQAKSSLEERNASLNENIIRLREELRSAESRKAALEQDLRHAQSELAESYKKCSTFEASLQAANRVRVFLRQNSWRLGTSVVFLHEWN